MHACSHSQQGAQCYQPPALATRQHAWSRRRHRLNSTAVYAEEEHKSEHGSTFAGVQEELHLRKFNPAGFKAPGANRAEVEAAALAAAVQALQLTQSGTVDHEELVNKSEYTILHPPPTRTHNTECDTIPDLPLFAIDSQADYY